MFRKRLSSYLSFELPRVWGILFQFRIEAVVGLYSIGVAGDRKRVL